jgi:hypothetical protein
MSGSKTSLDRMEQSLRIQQLRADIALKKQTLILAPAQVLLLFAGASSALLTAIFAGLKLLLGS